MSENEAAEMLESRHDLNLDASETIEAENLEGKPVTRFEADLAGKAGVWTGVRSCSDAERARAALEVPFNAWLVSQINANPGRVVLRHGWGPAVYWYENRTRSGGRSCKAGFHTAPVYVEFC